jgi:hypothetical protein
LSTQQIIAVFDTITDAIRAKDICRALRIGTDREDTEGPEPSSNAWSNGGS